MKVPKSPKRDLLEEGTHNAICVVVADLGTQPSNNPQWEDKRQIALIFEAVDAATKDGKPNFISRTYTFSGSQKGNLAKHLKSWLGVKSMDDYEIDNVLGKPALLNIVHTESKDGNTYANIDTILTPKGKVRRAQTDLLSVYLDKSFDQADFEKLPEWVRNKIAGTQEFELVFKPKKGKEAKGKK